jgi:hypothetical protein
MSEICNYKPENAIIINAKGIKPKKNTSSDYYVCKIHNKTK